MCLTSFKKVESKEPITCYKVLLQYGSKFCTPFVYKIVSSDELTGKTNIIATGDGKIGSYCTRNSEGIPDWNKVPAVAEGYIHTYADKASIAKDYFEFFKKLSNVYKLIYKVFECEISMQDNICYSGLFDEKPEFPGYASKYIRIRRQVKDSELSEWYNSLK